MATVGVLLDPLPPHLANGVDRLQQAECAHWRQAEDLTSSLVSSMADS
jgi:hypothetical protein